MSLKFHKIGIALLIFFLISGYLFFAFEAVIANFYFRTLVNLSAISALFMSFWYFYDTHFNNGSKINREMSFHTFLIVSSYLIYMADDFYMYDDHYLLLKFNIFLILYFIFFCFRLSGISIFVFIIAYIYFLLNLYGETINSSFFYEYEIYFNYTFLTIIFLFLFLEISFRYLKKISKSKLNRLLKKYSLCFLSIIFIYFTTKVVQNERILLTGQTLKIKIPNEEFRDKLREGIFKKNKEFIDNFNSNTFNYNDSTYLPLKINTDSLHNVSSEYFSDYVYRVKIYLKKYRNGFYITVPEDSTYHTYLYGEPETNYDHSGDQLYNLGFAKLFFEFYQTEIILRDEYLLNTDTTEYMIVRCLDGKGLIERINTAR